MNITVVGLGFVGSSTAVLLSKNNNVISFDTNPERVNALKNKFSPINNELMTELIGNRSTLTATDDYREAFDSADYIIVATNTQLNPETKTLDISSIESVMERAASFFDGKMAPTIVIRSTVPIGFTDELANKYPEFSFLFWPEFLREKTAMEDMLAPFRIIVGYDKGNEETSKSKAEDLSNLVLSCVDDPETPVLLTGIKEAESVKLFSNSYLALRVAFFNQLDSFASYNDLDSASIIKGVSFDPRIGDYYNKPSSGFAGACLPKDTLQLIADFKDLPEVLIRAAVEANEKRREFVKDVSYPSDKEE